MRRPAHPSEHKELTRRLAGEGLRSTPQREQVYDVLLAEPNHPTAEEVFIRSKKKMPDISMATVYNCLDALVKCGMVKQVAVQRGAARFCPNMREHGHFYCESCGGVFDVDVPAEPKGVHMPKGFKVDHYEIAIHGVCAACGTRRH